jgi:lactoylglutathione lyase
MTKTIFALCTAAAVALSVASQAADPKVGFTSETIDLGLVVSDLEKSVKFYTEGLGMKEATPFSVPADWTKDVGLTDGKKLDIRVLVLGNGEKATKLKLMQVEGKAPKKGDKKFLNSELGFRYLTIFVTDIDATTERLKKAGYSSASKGGMVALPEGFPKDVYLMMVRDPDGNMVELVGPKGSSKK